MVIVYEMIEGNGKAFFELPYFGGLWPVLLNPSLTQNSKNAFPFLRHSSPQEIMIRICYFTHDLRHDYGSGVFSRRLIEGIKQRMGCEVEVLTSEYTGAPYEKAILLPQRFGFLRNFFRIRRIIKECNIIHALDGYPYGAIAALASLGLKKPLVITGLGSGAVLPFYRFFSGLVFRWSLRRANAITAISHFTRDEMFKKAPGFSIRVINPGVDMHGFDADYGIRGPWIHWKPYLLSVGTLRWRKGHHFSLRAFAEVFNEFPHLHYVIVGKRYKDDYYQRLEKLISEFGLKDRVHILDTIDRKEELQSIYKNAELFCLFSQNVGHDIEGFGMVFLEAAAAGLPVVGSKNCGIEDAMEEGKNGLLVATRDPHDFAKAILDILRNPELKKRMSAASLDLARRSSWDNKIKEYIDIYRSLV